MPNLANPLFPEMVKSAQHRLRGHNLAALLGDSDDDADDELRLVHALTKDVDGLILFSSLLRDEQIDSIRQLSPTVFVNRRVEGFHCVLVDALPGMRALVQYLSNLGHSSALYLSGPDNAWGGPRPAAGHGAGGRGGLPGGRRDGTETPPLRIRRRRRGPAGARQASDRRGLLQRRDGPGAHRPAARTRRRGAAPGQRRRLGRLHAGQALDARDHHGRSALAKLGAAAVDELLAARDEQKEPAGRILDPAPVVLEVSLVTRATTARARTR